MWVLTLLLGCSAKDGEEPAPEPSGNVLIVLLDDIGIDKVASYGVGAPTPYTPTIDGLVASGLRFSNAWSYSTCSPARAALLTGRHARRYGIGDWIEPWEDPARLAQEEVTLPEMLRASDVPWDSSLVGKWHLTTFMGDHEDIPRDPGAQGFAWHAGTLANIDNIMGPVRPNDPGYYRWEKDTNGVLAIENRYATVVTTDDGIARMDAMSEPWLMVVAYNAAHSPLAPPPPELVPEITRDTEITLFDAVVQATDHEVGRLLDALPSRTTLPTTIVLTADNGTPYTETDPTLQGRGGKGSPYELGVRVPLIIDSPLLSSGGEHSDALVHLTDLFATLAELAHVDLAQVKDARGQPLEHDSMSLVPYLRDSSTPSARALMYSEGFWPNGPPPYAGTKVSVRSLDLKYVRNQGTEELYALGADGLEGPDLLPGPLTADQQQALDEMRIFADENVSVPFEY